MSIVDNKKAFHDYFIEDRYEAGLCLTGWEIKAIRSGKAHIREAYVIIKGTELFLFGAHITPLPEASRFVETNPIRTRKLLLKRAEIDKLIGKVTTKGYTVVPLNLHYSGGRVKCDIGLARGKKQHDKRATERDRDAKMEVNKAMKQNTR